MRRVGGRRAARDADRAPSAEVLPGGLVVPAEPLEPLVGRVGRTRVVDDEVPVSRDSPERPSRAADRDAEARVRHAVDLADERRTGGELGRRGPVEDERDPKLRVAGVVALAAPERLDHVPDRVRVPVVDEERPWFVIHAGCRAPEPEDLYEPRHAQSPMRSRIASTTRSALRPSTRADDRRRHRSSLRRELARAREAPLDPGGDLVERARLVERSRRRRRRR